MSFLCDVCFANLGEGVNLQNNFSKSNIDSHYAKYVILLAALVHLNSTLPLIHFIHSRNVKGMKRGEG